MSSKENLHSILLQIKLLIAQLQASHYLRKKGCKVLLLSKGGAQLLHMACMAGNATPLQGVIRLLT